MWFHNDKENEVTERVDNLVMDDQLVAAVIRQSRILHGYSQLQVARMCGINLGQYQRLEYGQRAISQCSMKLGLSICMALDLDPFLLVFGKSTW